MSAAALDEAKAKLVSLASHPSESGAGASVSQFWKMGAVDYKQVPQLEGVDLEAHRKASRLEVTEQLPSDAWAQPTADPCRPIEDIGKAKTAEPYFRPVNADTKSSTKLVHILAAYSVFSHTSFVASIAPSTASPAGVLAT